MKKNLILLLAIAVVPLVIGTTWIDSGTGNRNYASSPNVISITTTGLAFGPAQYLTNQESFRLRTIQNVGTVPVLYALGTIASATNFHGVLAAGLVARDGLGSVVDLSNWRGSVSIAVESGTGTVTATEVVR